MSEARAANLELRKKCTMLIIKNQAATWHTINEFPITDDMWQLTKGLNVTTETLKAFRLLCA